MLLKSVTRIRSLSDVGFEPTTSEMPVHVSNHSITKSDNRSLVYCTDVSTLQTCQSLVEPVTSLLLKRTQNVTSYHWGFEPATTGPVDHTGCLVPVRLVVELICVSFTRKWKQRFDLWLFKTFSKYFEFISEPDSLYLSRTLNPINNWTLIHHTLFFE